MDRRDYLSFRRERWGKIDTRELKSGSRVGAFELIRVIGTGGMGIVYEARDLRLGRTVALKVLAVDLFAKPTARRRFLREAQLAASITHPNVAAIHEADEHESIPYIAMELVPGVNLKERLSSGPLPADEVIGIGLQVCEALDAAHGRGIIHRDIKSSNVVVTADGTAKVLDFGLAKGMVAAARESDSSDPSAGILEPAAAESEVAAEDDATPSILSSGSTLTGVAVGTPSYMSPEQAAGRAVDARSDLFSLGIVLYEAATGTLPFRGRTERETLAAIRTRDPAPPPENVSRPLWHVISRCLAKDPAARYQSATEAKAALAQAGQPSATLRLRQGIVRHLPRRRLPRAILLVALVAMLGLGAHAIWRAGVRSPEADALAIRSIVVLPFRYIAARPGYEYFGVGLAGVLSATITRARFVEVRSPGAFEESTTEPSDPLTVGRRLGVDAVLAGTYRVEEDALSLSYTLLDVRRNVQIAGAAIEGSFTNSIEVEHRLATQILASLQSSIRPGETTQRTSAPTTRNEAFQSYLRSQYEMESFWRQPTAERLRRAERHLDDALKADSGFTMALISLAKLHWISVFWGYADDTFVLQRARKIVHQALKLDPALGDAYAIQALLDFQDGQLDPMRESLQKAFKFSPSSATAYYGAGFYYLAHGLADESIRAFLRAKELSPDQVRREIGLAYRFAGDFANAERQLREDLFENPSDVLSSTSLVGVLVSQGRLAEAEEAARGMRERAPEDPSVQSVLALVRISRGESFSIEAWLETYGEEYWSDAGYAVNVAAAYAMKGRHGEALRWLRRARELGLRSNVFLERNPLYDNLRDQPEFQELVESLRSESEKERVRESTDPILPPARSN